MKKILLTILYTIFYTVFSVLNAQNTNNLYISPTEGIIDHSTISEQELKRMLIQSLVDFSPCLIKNYKVYKYNIEKDPTGYFKSLTPNDNREDAVRTNADMAMVCAFLVKYAQPLGMQLPNGIKWETLKKMAITSLTYAYSTHVAVKQLSCSNNEYWGNNKSNEQWQASLWAMSVAYTAFFLWDDLTPKMRHNIEYMLFAECNHIISKPITTKFEKNTYAEENGWDVDVLAATIGLFPNNPKASSYFNFMRKLAVNVLSNTADLKNKNVIDPNIDKSTPANFFVGANLFSDYTLQNHSFFHPGYQHVAIQELGEAALALSMFQKKIIGQEKFRTDALFHNCQTVQDSVLNYLALPDGELAMPNGNDWSLFLFDQITTYSTLACFLRNSDALMLETQALKNIIARQSTTGNGEWLLNPDVAQRRMAVQAHRVMMTYLMHELNSTAQLSPTPWDDFNSRYYKAKLFPCQNVVRASSPYRYMIFSMTPSGNNSGYFVPNLPDRSKIVIPYYSSITGGSIIGWYRENLGNRALKSVKEGAPTYTLDSNSFVLKSDFSINGGSLKRRMALYCTPGNAIIYHDIVKCYRNTTIKDDNSGVLCISFDKFTNLTRQFYHANGHDTISNGMPQEFYTPWLNIDNTIGIISRTPYSNFKLMEPIYNSSIQCRVLASGYNGKQREFKNDSIADSHAFVFLSKVTQEETQKYNDLTTSLTQKMPAGWTGIITTDNTGTYVMISNFFGQQDSCSIQGLEYNTKQFFPIFGKALHLHNNTASIDINIKQGNTIATRAHYGIRGQNLTAQMCENGKITISTLTQTKAKVSYCNPTNYKIQYTKNLKIKKGNLVTIEYINGKLKHTNISL